MIELKSARDKSNFINNLVKESFYNKMKLKDGISFNSVLSGERISFSVYNNFGIIVYESFNNIDSLKELLNESNKSEDNTNEFFTPYSIVKKMCDKIPESDQYNES